MIKQILVCDRCGCETQIAYRIKAFPISANDTFEGTAQHLGENTDYCPACLRTIATLADTAPLPMIPVPDEEEPAQDAPVEPSAPEEAPEQVEVEHIITEEPDEAPETAQSAEEPAGEEKIAKVRNLGAACLEELKTVMPNYGLAFAEPEYIAPPYLRSIPKGFIKLTKDDNSPIMIRADMIEAFVKGIDDAEGRTVIFMSGYTGDNGSYWVNETVEEVCALINNTRR